MPFIPNRGRFVTSVQHYTEPGGGLWLLYDFHTLTWQFCNICNKSHTLQKVPVPYRTHPGCVCVRTCVYPFKLGFRVHHLIYLILDCCRQTTRIWELLSRFIPGLWTNGPMKMFYLFAYVLRMRGSSLRSLAYSDLAWPYGSKFTTGSLVQQVNRGSRKWSTDLYTKVYFIFCWVLLCFPINLSRNM